MEYRVIANENPVGSRRWFEDRINLHLRFGWYPVGGLVAAGVAAHDWGHVHRGNQESLFVFQALAHSRADGLNHLAGLAAEAKALLTKDEAALSAPERRQLGLLLAYLDAELEFHGPLFPDKEAAEEGAEIPLSKERIKKALRPPA